MYFSNIKIARQKWIQTTIKPCNLQVIIMAQDTNSRNLRAITIKLGS